MMEGFTKWDDGHGRWHGQHRFERHSHPPHVQHGMLGLGGLLRGSGDCGGCRWWRLLASSSEQGGGLVRGVEWIGATCDGHQIVGSKGSGSPSPHLALSVGNATIAMESEETLTGGRCRGGQTSSRVAARRAPGG